MARRSIDPGESSRTLAALRRLLREDGIRPDGRLPGETALGRRLGASRQAVRRALDVLEAEGRIWRRPGGEAWLSPPEAPATSEAVGAVGAVGAEASLMEARRALEPALAALAARRATQADLRRLRRVAARGLAAGDEDGLELWGAAFHRAVAVAAGNPALLSAFEALHAVRLNARADRPVRPAAAEGPPAMREHAVIAAAIAAGEAERAAQAMREHLDAQARRRGLLPPEEGAAAARA
ncbi:MAG: FCD domain-containing protein [Pseudomonadota bacterium]